MPNRRKHNGSHHFGDDDKTPSDLPTPAPLDEHKAYIVVLADLSGRLGTTNRNIARLIHELRVARAPLGRKVIGDVREMFSSLERIGKAGKAGFSK